MENKACENKRGMIISKKTAKHHGFSRAFSIFSHYSAENAQASLPMLSDEVNAHQIERLNVERWQHKIAENVHHNTFR